jgi:hypothetical protein
MAKGIGIMGVELERGPRATAKRFDDIQRRLRRPMANGGATIVAHIMRHGGGSVSRQFQTTTYINRTGARIPWKRTKKFGRRPPPPRTLHRTGALERAWTGTGAGSFTRHTNTRVVIGVDRSKFPHASVFQTILPTIVRPKPPLGARGRHRMGWFLGMRFGVWLSNARLEQGLKIFPRRLGVNPEMTKRARVGLREFLITGKATVARNI